MVVRVLGIDTQFAGAVDAGKVTVINGGVAKYLSCCSLLCQVEKGMVVQMGMEGGKPNGVGNVSGGNTGHANEDVVMQLITQAWQCKLSALMIMAQS